VQIVVFSLANDSQACEERERVLQTMRKNPVDVRSNPPQRCEFSPGTTIALGSVTGSENTTQENLFRQLKKHLTPVDYAGALPQAR